MSGSPASRVTSNCCSRAGSKAGATEASTTTVTLAPDCALNRNQRADAGESKRARRYSIVDVVALFVALSSASACGIEVIELGPERVPVVVECQRLLGEDITDQEPLLLGEGGDAGSAVLRFGSAEPFYFEVLLHDVVDDGAGLPVVGVAGESGALLASRVLDEEPADIIIGVAVSVPDEGVAYRREGLWQDGADPESGIYPQRLSSTTAVKPALRVGAGERVSIILERFRDLAPGGHVTLAQPDECE